jgi:hypothetical protein
MPRIEGVSCKGVLIVVMHCLGIILKGLIITGTQNKLMTMICKTS